MTVVEEDDMAQAAAAAMRAAMPDGSSSSSMAADIPVHIEAPPAPVTPPAAMSTLLQQLCLEAGADQDLLVYLTSRGICNHHKMANLAENVEELEHRLISRWLQGHDISGKIHQTSDDEVSARATIVSIWRLARNMSHQPVASVVKPSDTQITPTTQDAAKKAPTSLAPGVWNEQIAKYNSVIIQGQAREFLEKTLLGAESILARMIFEKQHKMFQPLKLGEILSTRA